VFIEIYR